MTRERVSIIHPMKRAFTLALIALAFCALAAAWWVRRDSIAYAQISAPLLDGDVIFQESRSAQSVAIKQASGSRYTHMGMVFGAGTDEVYVLEAVQPVRRTPLRKWIARGHDGHFVVMRLRDAALMDVDALKRAAEAFIGRDYDLTFDWSDERMYCSEIVWKAHERALHVRLGEPQPWRALNINAAAANQLANKRLGHAPDPDALVITPVRIMQSPLLQQVASGALD